MKPTTEKMPVPFSCSNIRAYWSDEHFQPVAGKFDALLRAKGWLKEP